MESYLLHRSLRRLNYKYSTRLSFYAVRVTDIVPVHSVRSTNVRNFSSRRRDDESRRFKLDGLPFSVSPGEALKKFNRWASIDQGLDYVLNEKTVRIGAAYCPVWSFDVNVRFVTKDAQGRRQFGWKPSAFSAFGTQSVIHIPGLSAYSGYSFRRSLLNPLHNTSLVFLGSETVRFGQWMLRDMDHEGQRLEVFPDPWTATRGRAYAVVKEELEMLAQQESEVDVIVQTETVASRRVMMPTYVIDYKVLGVEYQAFVSGADSGAGVSGENHAIWSSNKEAFQASQSFLSQAASAAQSGARVLGGRGIFMVLQLLVSLLGRVLVRLPLVAFPAAIFVGFRKVIQPFFNRR
jgi:hypothetical protein